MSEQSRDFHKPVRRPAEVFDRHFAVEDPAEVSRMAHASASALLTRVRAGESAEAADRLVSFTSEHGIDTLARLWSPAPARSLPGALWRLYLLQTMVRSGAALVALMYERGRMRLRSSDDVVAGAPTPAGAEELVALIDTILRGAFVGDFALALDRAAAYARIVAAGATELADDADAAEPERASALTRRALRLSGYAHDLSASAALWRRGALN